MLSGCRLSHQLREFKHRRHQLGFRFTSTNKTLHLSYFLMLSPPSVFLSTNRFCYSSSSSILDSGFNPHVACIQSNSPTGDIPLHPDTFSHQEDDHEPPSEFSPVAGGIVALGKFDALHIGHRELAIQAAKVGVPFLLSFVGMAEVLGWEPRPPIVARCDRKRILSSWAPYCGGIIPKEFHVDFSKVRYLSPQEFVDKLSNELGVLGVVAGKNYRFGFKAAGDASELVRLCGEYGLGAYIINSVMDKYQNLRDDGFTDSKEQGQVSSTRVRHALAKGDMKYVTELLGRKHRVILNTKKDNERFTRNRKRVSAFKSCLLNLSPKEGKYDNCSVLIGGDDWVVSCRVVIDSTHIHLEFDEVDTCANIISQEFEFLGIEFGDSGP